MSDYILLGEIRRLQDGLEKAQRITQERSRDETREQNKRHKELMAVQRINTLALLASQGFTEAHDALTKNVTVDGLELSVLSDEACYALNLPKFHSDTVEEHPAVDEDIKNAAWELVARHQRGQTEPSRRTYLEEEPNEEPEEAREPARASYIPDRLNTRSKYKVRLSTVNEAIDNFNENFFDEKNSKLSSFDPKTGTKSPFNES